MSVKNHVHIEICINILQQNTRKNCWIYLLIILGYETTWSYIETSSNTKHNKKINEYYTNNIKSTKKTKMNIKENLMKTDLRDQHFGCAWVVGLASRWTCIRLTYRIIKSLDKKLQNIFLDIQLCIRVGTAVLALNRKKDTNSERQHANKLSNMHLYPFCTDPPPPKLVDWYKCD